MHNCSQLLEFQKVQSMQLNEKKRKKKSLFLLTESLKTEQQSATILSIIYI